MAQYIQKMAVLSIAILAVICFIVASGCSNMKNYTVLFAGRRIVLYGL